MLEKNDILIITAATNGFMLTRDNEELVDDERELHVFNSKQQLLEHLDTMLSGQTFEAIPATLAEAIEV